MARARRRKAGSSLRLPSPSAWNTLRFRLSLLPLFNPLLEFPIITRRNTLIHTVAAACGDIAAGVAVAAACVWLIEAATLGLFLSFLVWLLGALIALALSQYVVHPLAAMLLSSHKLDDGLGALTDLAREAARVGPKAAQQLCGRFMPGARHPDTA